VQSKSKSEVVINTFGSCDTGLDLPSSDLDIVIQLGSSSGGKRNTNLNSNVIMSNLSQDIMTLAWASDVKCILTSRVPVVKFMADGRSLLKKKVSERSEEL